jgi:hypothetical protein
MLKRGDVSVQTGAVGSRRSRFRAQQEGRAKLDRVGAGLEQGFEV